MKYYIMEFADEFNCLNDEKVSPYYGGISLNLGTPYKELPTITLVVDANNTPNCIPNHRRYLYLDAQILQIFEECNFKKFQFFDLHIINKKGKTLNLSHKLINITNVVNCIDREKSKLILDEEENDPDLNIEDIRILKLDHSNIKDNVIFRLGGFETLLVFREDVVTALELNKCTGLQFVNADGYSI